MATLSLKSIAASCLGKGLPLRVRRDVFGYPFGEMDRELSLKSHLELIRGKAFNLSPILVGHEPDFSGEFDLADAQRMQAAIDVMRGLYAQVNLGIRKIYWSYIPSDQAGGFTSVDGSEATDLTEAYSAANDGIDVFWVTEVTDAGGWSKTNGSCDKDTKGERTGAVLELKGSDSFTGILLAHEVGHYLGLPHAGDITNVMGDDSDGNGIGQIDGTSVNLTPGQGTTMRSHCSVKPAC